MMPLIEFSNVTKSFISANSDKSTQVLSDFDWKIKEGEIVTLFGPNGSGKTTILNLLAKLEHQDSGQIIYKNENLSVGYVFQSYADTLLPWRTVRENIEFPLEVQNVSYFIRKLRTQRRMKQFGLLPHADKYIYQLSGGLKQLVAIVRSTIYNPQLLLLDEPFSALDYSNSRRLWLIFRKFWEQQKITTVFVSHNIDEAVFLGNTVYVLPKYSTGKITKIPVDIGQERNLSVLTTDKFLSVRNQIIETFEKSSTI